MQQDTVEKLRERDSELGGRVHTLDSMLFLTANGSSPFSEGLPDLLSLSADGYPEQDDSNGISNAWVLGLMMILLMRRNSNPANRTV